MKGIVEIINEAASVDRKLSFDLYNDVYNLLADMSYEYDKKGEEFSRDDMEDVFDWFLERFFDQIRED